VLSVTGGPFGEVRGDGRVTVGGESADVLVWSDTHIVVRVPRVAKGVRSFLVATARGQGHAELSIAERSAAPPMPTFVTLSFDDTYAAQTAAAAELEAHGMRGTFYVNSVRLDRPGYMKLSDLEAMARAGHEIGGHSLHHLWLPLLAPDEQRRQICDDRARLLEHGFAVRSFAYPGGFQDDVTRGLVASCGYASARIVSGGLAEGLPLRDPFVVRISDTMRSVVELAQLTGWVSRFEAEGGWVNLVFHDVCDGCSSSAIPPERLAALSGWLAGRAGRGTFVRTFSELTGGALAPAVRAEPAAPRPYALEDGAGRAPNASFEETQGPSGVPSCWQRGDPGERLTAWSRTREAAQGSWAEALDGAATVDVASRRLRTFRDAGACAIPVTPGERIRITASVKGPSRAALSVSYRTTTGAWGGWSDGPDAAPTLGWQRVGFDLPPIARGTDAIAIGVVGLDRDALAVDDVRVEPIGVAAPAPTP
jgi:peptidoglycan/xylan/chitin deacetylase (PgdA/CDA1 family)